MKQQPKKLELRADVILKLKEIRDVLAGSPGLFNTRGLDTASCGAYCQATCAYYCRPTCTEQCAQNCSAYCDVTCSSNSGGGGPTFCASMEPYWY